jgi:hypothetical protein
MMTAELTLVLESGMVKPMAAIRQFIVSLFLFGFLILSSCSTFQKTQHEKHQALFVTATAFNSLPKQGGR